MPPKEEAMDDRITQEPMSAEEFEAEMLHRHETASDRSTVSLNELRHRAAVSGLQQK
jgi:hypothetical protein